MINGRIVIIIIILLLIGYLYNKWKNMNNNNKFNSDYQLVEKYFLGNKSLANIKKPIIWVHIPYDINARKWENFYSRNNMNLNQDYLYLTLRSIIEKLGINFHICLINDNSFKKLLSKWPEDLSSYPEPIRSRYRSLGMANLLYEYGGLTIPVSFIANKCFSNIYENLDEDKILIGEKESNKISDKLDNFNRSIMGCKKGSKKMKEYIFNLEKLYIDNYTNSIEFNNSIEEWLNNSKCYLEIIPARLLGKKDKCGNDVNLENLLGNYFIDMDEERYGIDISQDELLRRTSLNWFVYLNIIEVLKSDTQIGNYILISQQL